MVVCSDKPGHHDFELLKKLVLSDGTVLRAQLPGRPTRDCLFTDPARDGKSLLKIWNRNMYGGVVAAFNCQGAGWCKLDKQYLIHDPNPDKITGGLCANDVEQLAKVAPTDWEGDCVIYSHRGGELVQLHQSAMLPLTLQKLEYEVFTVAPLKNLGPEVMFAPVGLVTMFNSGAAIMSLEYNVPDTSVVMVIRGEGCFGAFASQCPAQCILDSVEITPIYEQTTGLLLLSLPIPQEAHFWTLKIQFMDNTGLI
jgi:raffinose synthase